MSTVHKHNFGAGPCILPPAVTEKASAAVRDYKGSGLSILEISHRSPEFLDILKRTEALVRELLEVPMGYQVLFMQGGASSQFSMVAQNFLLASPSGKAAYLDGGFFGLKAIAEAEYFGKVKVLGCSKDRGYRYAPSCAVPRGDEAYLHITSNNTIEGTQVKAFPLTGVPLVCDMSSDIFSRRIKVRDFALIYAGAQKNMGPAGMTLVIIKDSFLDRVRHKLPAMSDYRTYRDHGSLYNTPPVFSIYTAMLNLEWLKEQGGVEAIERLNEKKAELLYGFLDRCELFKPTAEKGHRSMMNVTFACKAVEVEEAFLRYAEQRGIVGIRGFRTMGGFRASLYNALPLHSVEYLVKTMRYFEKSIELKNSLKERTAAI